MCLALWSSQSLIHNQPFWKSKSWCSGEMGIGNAGLGWQGKLWSHELLLPVGSVGSMKEGARAGSHHPWRNACVCRWGWKEQSRQVRTVRTQGQTKARTHIQREMIFLEEVGPQIAGGQWGSDENLEEAVLAVFKWGLTVMRRAIEGTKWKGEKLFFLKISELWDRGRLKIQWGKKSRIYGTKDMIRAFPLNEIHFHHHIYVAHH